MTLFFLLSVFFNSFQCGELRRFTITLEYHLSCMYFMWLRWARLHVVLHIVTGSDLSVYFVCPCIIDGYLVFLPYLTMWIIDSSWWCLLILKVVPDTWSDDVLAICRGYCCRCSWRDADGVQSGREGGDQVRVWVDADVGVAGGGAHVNGGG